MRILLLDSGKGLIPFIKEILKIDKRNEYYLFMDYQFFPYGNKSQSQLKKRLEYLLKKFAKLNIDYLLICCNTLSNIYLSNHFSTPYKIKTILSLNLRHLKNNNILVTPSLKNYYQNDNRFISSQIAEYIEHDEIDKLIMAIKEIKSDKKLILGCTHYPLAKNLFNHYCPFEIVSYEEEFILKLPTSSMMSFYGREYERKIFLKYFPHLIINEYSIT